ncbi:MAG: metallophosphoesterase [Haloarculaceae archaeon]
MKIGVIADTHDDSGVIEQAVSRFSAESVDVVIHCGDFVAPFSAEPFDREFEFYAVRGNNDGEWALGDVVGDFGTYLGEMGELSFDGAEVAVYHGTSEPIVDALVDCGRYDYVFHGHTHEYVHEERGGTVRINPGGLPIDAAPETPYAVVLDPGTGDLDRFPLAE